MKLDLRIILVAVFLVAGIVLMVLYADNEKEVSTEQSLSALNSAKQAHIVAVLDGAASEQHKSKIMGCSVDYASSLAFSNRKVEPFAYENEVCYSYMNDVQQNLSIRECESMHAQNGVFTVYIYPGSKDSANRFFRNSMQIHVPEDFTGSCATIREE